MSTYITPTSVQPQQYPFVGQDVNAINSIIKDIKLSLAVQQAVCVFLMNLSIRQSSVTFSLGIKRSTDVAAQPPVILQYTGALQSWLNIDQPACYGFIHFAQLDEDTVMFFPGEFYLHKKTYYLQRPSEGIRQLKVQKGDLTIQHTLNILFTGDVQCTKSEQEATIIHIKNVPEKPQNYYTLTSTQGFVYTIDHKPCQNLKIQSLSSAISVSGPFKVAQDVYVLQLDTDSSFPTCERQAMEIL